MAGIEADLPSAFTTRRGDVCNLNSPCVPVESIVGPGVKAVVVLTSEGAVSLSPHEVEVDAQRLRPRYLGEVPVSEAMKDLSLLPERPVDGVGDA